MYNLECILQYCCIHISSIFVTFSLFTFLIQLIRITGEHEIDPNGKNTFLYAFGSSNQLGYHSSNRSPFTVMLDASESSTPGTY